MGENFIEYKSWKSGKLIERELSTSYPSEQKTELICPFDDTPIIRYYDGHVGKGYECPNCEIDYKISRGTQENVNTFAKKYFEAMELDLEKLEKQKNNLEARLNHAKIKGLIENEIFEEFTEDLFSKNKGKGLFHPKYENDSFFQPDEINYNTSHESYASLAILAQKINKIAKINKNNKANLSSKYNPIEETKHFPFSIKSKTPIENLLDFE